MIAPIISVLTTEIATCKPFSGSFFTMLTRIRCWLSDGTNMNSSCGLSVRILTTRIGNVGAIKTTLTQVCASL